MNYALISTALELIEYPTHPNNYLPNVSIPEGWAGGMINGYLFVAVEETTPPAPTSTQRVIETSPVFSGGTWQRQFQLAPLTKDEVLANIAAIRWNKERQGVKINNQTYATDDVSQTKYLGILMAVQQNPAFTVNWKTEEGFVTLAAADIVTVVNTVLGHVQACFDHEKNLRDQITPMIDPNAWAAVDIDSGWPA